MMENQSRSKESEHKRGLRTTEGAEDNLHHSKVQLHGVEQKQGHDDKNEHPEIHYWYQK